MTSDVKQQSVLLDQIDRLRLRTHRQGRANYLAAKRLRRLHTGFGLPTVALGALVGTSVFASLGAQQHSVSATVAVGTISILSTVLAGAQTFLKFEDRASKHKNAGSQYMTQKRELDLLRARLEVGELEAKSAFDRLDSLAAKISALDSECPDVPDRYYDRARKEQVEDVEGV